jgi:hypothetical protein
MFFVILLREPSRENEKCGSEITESYTASTTKNIKYSFFLYAIADDSSGALFLPFFKGLSPLKVPLNYRFPSLIFLS